MKLKKVLALTMAAMLTVTALAGCGNSGTDSPEESQTEQSKESAEPEESEASNAGDEVSAESSGEKTVITVWTKDRHDAEFMQGKIDEYNATNTDNIPITIRRQWTWFSRMAMHRTCSYFWTRYSKTTTIQESLRISRL